MGPTPWVIICRRSLMPISRSWARRSSNGGTDQAKIADYLRSHTFHTLVGDVKFGPNREWAEPHASWRCSSMASRVTTSISSGRWPRKRFWISPALKTGDLKYPFPDARQ